MRALNIIAWAVVALLSISIALVSYRYVLKIGPIADAVAGNVLRSPWLPIHAAGAATALLIGPVQFLPSIRNRFPGIHRWMGRTYAVSCLVGGASGFMLALGASTGFVSTAGFGILAVLWIVTTSLAWRHATQRNFVDHRAWMIRSFALTFAAVTLRLYLPLLFLLPISFEDGYRAVSFLCWVPNLVLAEFYLRRWKTR